MRQLFWLSFIMEPIQSVVHLGIKLVDFTCSHIDIIIVFLCAHMELDIVRGNTPVIIKILIYERRSHIALRYARVIQRDVQSLIFCDAF